MEHTVWPCPIYVTMDFIVQLNDLLAVRSNFHCEKCVSSGFLCFWAKCWRNFGLVTFIYVFCSDYLSLRIFCCKRHRSEFFSDRFQVKEMINVHVPRHDVQLTLIIEENEINILNSITTGSIDVFQVYSASCGPLMCCWTIARGGCLRDVL